MVWSCIPLPAGICSQSRDEVKLRAEPILQYLISKKSFR